jgi:Fic family protein
MPVETIAVPAQASGGGCPSPAETVVPRVGRLVAQPGGYRALVPSPLPPDPSLRPTRALVQLFDEAVRALAEFSADRPRRDLAVREETHEDRNVRQVAELLARGVAESGWSIDLLCAAHKNVVREARGADRFPGRIRRAQSWVGDSLESASFVPPPGNLLRELLAELVAFLDDPDGFAPLVTAALAFAQVVSIHAFNDGNGRLGRAVAVAVLNLDGLPPELPLNRYLRMNRGAHLRAIEAVQQRGEWEEWIAFFLWAAAGSTRT